jgi:hypothetical protein
LVLGTGEATFFREGEQAEEQGDGAARVAQNLQLASNLVVI